MRENPYISAESSTTTKAGRQERAELIERLFREHNEALLRFLQARLRSYQEARDVAQEAYVRLLSLDQPGAVSYLRAFLFKTAANLAVDRKRRYDIHSRATAEPIFREFVDTLTPERRTAGEQQLQRLERLIAALPPKARQAFVLNQVHGRDLPSVAKDLGLSESMVRKYVLRVLLDLRVRLDLENSDGS
jgi:RNA polymerase sigma factor (sigma-70 family)